MRFFKVLFSFFTAIAVAYSLKVPNFIKAVNRQINLINGKILAKCSAQALLLGFLSVQPAAAQQTLKDQLMMLQKEKICSQRDVLSEERSLDVSLLPSYRSGEQIAKAVITIPDEKMLLSDNPYGINAVRDLDPSLASNDAALILTAVDSEGQPVAAKKFKLNELRFPLFVQLTAEDLMFPYTEEAWISSKSALKNVAINAIIDPDGHLKTSEGATRYGYAISHPVHEGYLNRINRDEAFLRINMKATGDPYTAEETRMFSRIDDGLDRMGFSQIPSALTQREVNEQVDV